MVKLSPFVGVTVVASSAARLSPGAAYRFAALSFGVGVAIFLAMYAAGYPATSALFWVPVVFAGLGRGALNYIPWATYNYMADVDEIVTARRREGAFAGVMTFTRKMAQAGALIAAASAHATGTSGTAINHRPRTSGTCCGAQLVHCSR